MGLSTVANWLRTIRGRLYLAFAGIILLAFSTVFFGIEIFEDSADSVKSVVAESTERMRFGNDLAGAAARLSDNISQLAGARTREEKETFSGVIDEQWQLLQHRIETRGSMDAAIHAKLQKTAGSLRETLRMLEASVEARLDWDAELTALGVNLEESFEALRERK